MTRRGRWAGLVLGALLAPAFAACPPDGVSHAQLRALKAQRWQAPADDAERAGIAVGLLDCLGDPDPLLRDGIAFDALQAWMRAGRLAPTTLQAIRLRLLGALDAAPDAGGFAQPFAALVLAEVARADRLHAFLSEDELDGLVAAGTRWLASVRDYRGFDGVQGWRHGVAHAADLMLQLALNPRLQRRHGEAIRAAVAAQVMADGAHAYRFGEPERLVAPIYYLARRDWWSAAEWQAWFDALGARRQRPAVPTAASLAQRHNLAAFVAALYVPVQESTDAVVRERLLPGLRRALAGLE